MFESFPERRKMLLQKSIFVDRWGILKPSSWTIDRPFTSKSGIQNILNIFCSSDIMQSLWFHSGRICLFLQGIYSLCVWHIYFRFYFYKSSCFCCLAGSCFINFSILVAWAGRCGAKGRVQLCVYLCHRIGLLVAVVVYYCCRQ